MKKSLLLAASAAALVLTMTACGQQTDERVAPADASAVATAPFVSVDCVSGEALPTDTAPDGTTIDGVTAVFLEDGSPSITVATGSAPATELGVADISVGSGPAAAAGDTLTVNYCGVGLGSQTLFDSSWSRGEPATFPLDGVIPGWQQGVPGMQVGGQRLLVIPGELGYGEQGTAGIAPNETLIFVVELVSIG